MNDAKTRERIRVRAYAERQRNLNREHTPLLDLPLTAHQAVLDRASLGRPVAEGGWSQIGLALKRYEPTISVFAEDGLTEDQVWARAIGGEYLPNLHASHVLAIIDAGAPHVLVDPTWVDGARTELGAIYDERMPGLNVANWAAGLDRQFHRRYSRVHG